VVIDDSGLFVDCLKGFPGVYSSYVFGTLGCGGILRLMNDVKERGAHFECCIGCILESGESFVVCEKAEGRIGLEEKGTGGFGFDPIFIPEGGTRTFAEMTIEEKNPISHRGKAIAALVSELGHRQGVGNAASR